MMEFLLKSKHVAGNKTDKFSFDWERLDGPGSNLGAGEIFRTSIYRLWRPPLILYNGSQVFPGGRVAGAWRWPLTTSSAEVQERVELYPSSSSSSGPSSPVLRWNLP